MKIININTKNSKGKIYAKKLDKKETLIWLLHDLGINPTELASCLARILNI